MLTKRTFLILLSVLAIVAVAVVIGRLKWLREENTPTEILSIGTLPTVEKIDNGHKIIRYPDEQISISIPTDWNARVFPEISNGVSAEYKHIDTLVTADFAYHVGASPVLEEFKQENEYCTVEPENNGFKYYCQYLLGSKYYGNPEAGVREDSYVVGRFMSYRDGLIRAECRVYGPEYGSFISDCNEFVESLSIE
jgi:hypothetical protein